MKWVVLFVSMVASATPGVLDLPAATVVGYGSDFKFLAIDAEKKGYQYAYAADILQNGSTKSMAFCSFPTLPGEIDVLHFYTSPDNGLSWVDAKTDFHPNPEGERSACDPSRIKFGAYYYLYYSSLPLDIGSNIYVARSATAQGPWEKYIGNDRWSATADAKPQSIISSQRHIPVCGGGAVNDSPNDPNCANYSRYYGAGQ